MFFIILALFLICNITYPNTLGHRLSDESFEYKFNLPNNTYHQYCKIIYSQNGEDGILEQLIKELEIKNGTFCEFGASDGIESSNTYHLIKNFNFSGIAIELDLARFLKCVENYRPFTNVRVFHGAVLYFDKKNDLNAWLKKGNLPTDFDVLSIDIDHDDYYVWENLTEFNPKIVIFETNSYRDPVYEELPGKTSTEYNIDLLKQWHSTRPAKGCSFISAVTLGLKKGYIPVSYTGNLIFVRKDLVHKLKEFPYKISENPYDYLNLYTHLVLWKNNWHTNMCLIFNVAVRDYYMTFKRKHIDLDWLRDRMNEILNNENVFFSEKSIT
jgi:hypothetical protein